MLAFIMRKNDKENKTSKGKNKKKINEQRYLYWEIWEWELEEALVLVEDTEKLQQGGRQKS